MVVYDAPLLYDVAFGFRDVVRQCDFLMELADAHGVGPGDFLELACGPAQHAREMARRGYPSVGLDLSAAMIAYAAQRAAIESLPLSTLQGDMTDFAIQRKFAVAATLLDSTAHLLTNQQYVTHLDAVARHLEPGGIHVVEMGHPADVFRVRSTTSSSWTEERDGLRVTTSWGADDDPFDPITEVDQVSVTMDVVGPDKSYRVEQTLPQRRFSHGTVQALIAQSNMEAIAWYGGFSTSVAFDNGPEAWRMIAVLRAVCG